MVTLWSSHLVNCIGVDLFNEQISDVVDAAIRSLTLSADEAVKQGAMDADELFQTREHLIDRVTGQTDIGQQASNKHLANIHQTSTGSRSSVSSISVGVARWCNG